MKNNKGQSARKLALTVLSKANQRNTYVNKLLDHALDESNLAKRDRSFATALVFGVLKHQATLDKEIEKLSRYPFNKLSPFILTLLRIAFFQLIYMPNMPAFAIVFTSTELAKEKDHKGTASYVNGILRQYLRNNNVMLEKKSDALVDKINNQSTSLELAVSYSIPEWMICRWLDNYGYSQTICLLDFFQKQPDLVLRTNKRKTSTSSLIELFKTNKLLVRQGKLLEDCIIIETKSNQDKKSAQKLFKGSPKNLPGYKENLFIIQDEPSAFVAKVVSPRPTDFVVDLCAAPGNKTLYLSELMNNQGQILAVDKDKERLNYLKQKCLDLNIENIEIINTDTRQLSLKQKADKVLLDAPCTGTGVLHKRQDLRHKKQITDIDQLVALQRELLLKSSQLIKPGGVLVYSTCSIEPEENIDNIKWFLSKQSKFKGDDISSYIPTDTLKLWLKKIPTTEEQENFLSLLQQGMMQLLPFWHGLSGFFIARLVKMQ